MLSKLTLIGMNRYSKGAIWDNVLLPEGIEKDVLINEILRQGGEFCTIYPDQEYLTIQIGQFFKKWYHNFERWIKAYNFEYEALYNLDVKSTTTEEGQNYENGSKTSNDSRNVSGSTSGTSNGSNESVHGKAAYDSATFQNTQKDNGTSNMSTSGNSSEVVTANGSEVTSGNSNHKIVTEEYRRGNQGITMSQELLIAEFNAWRFNIYNQIADVFISEFCITVYF